jgi:hypothetical protein
MEKISAISIFCVYMILLLMAAGVNKWKPGVTNYAIIQKKNLSLLNGLHMAGIIVIVLSTLISEQQPVFLLSFPEKISISQAAAFLAVFGAIGFFPWKKFNRNTCEIESISSRGNYQIIFYSCIRSVFLVVYEWFFRGLLLLSFCNWLGNDWGIAINVLLYIMIHIHKNKKEMFGCIPFGILLAVFTIWWQSIWPAIIFHLQVSIINEWPPLQQFISPQKQTAI